jgi:NAD(P)H-hydrate epimerase
MASKNAIDNLCFMRIYSSKNIQNIEELTISSTGQSWKELMDVAASRFVESISQILEQKMWSQIDIFCGNGNNGGDGFVIAKMLSQTTKYNINVWIHSFSKNRSDLNQKHLKTLTHRNSINIYHIDNESIIPQFKKDNLLIDAIFGIGLNRPVLGNLASIFDQINSTNATVVSVDLPSGLMSDMKNNPNDSIIDSNYIVSFQYPKISLFFDSNLHFLNKCKFIDIGLDHSQYNKDHFGQFITAESNLVKIKDRDLASHKGKLGKAMIVGGSKGMYGAPLLSAGALQKVGAGYAMIQSCTDVLNKIISPELIQIESNKGEYVNRIVPITKAVYGLGPGIGRNKETAEAIKLFFNEIQEPVVLDADALYLISMYNLHPFIPKGSILTPHLGEFKHLIQKENIDDVEKIEFIQTLAKKHQCIIVLKGPYTCISDELGNLYFNSSGNESLAVAGSGDVLTGMITGFLAQGYSSLEAAVKGVFYHGKAADLFANEYDVSSLTPLSLIDFIDQSLKKEYTI